LSLISGHTYELNIKNNSATKKAGIALIYNDGESQVKQIYGAEWNTPAIFTVNSNVNNASLYFLTQNTGEENIDETLTDFSLTDISSAFASIKLKSTINKVTDFLYQKVSVYSETEKRYLIEPGTMFYTEEIEISNAVPFEDVKQNNKITISVEYATRSGFSLADIMTFTIRRDDNVDSETINSLLIDKDNLIIEAPENSSISRKNINTNTVEVVSLNSSSEFIDKTAEIGVLYEYYTTTTDDIGMHTNKFNIVCIDYDHMVLCTKDKTLRI
jgi:hypothetical protein